MLKFADKQFVDRGVGVQKVFGRLLWSPTFMAAHHGADNNPDICRLCEVFDLCFFEMYCKIKAAVETAPSPPNVHC